MDIVAYFIWFILYSFLGWFYESTVCSLVEHRKLINRGFLRGPYCPIYGAGAVLNLILLKDMTNLVAVFFIAMIVASAIEYVTSYLMERMFGARWWDYSHLPLNLNGRICLIGGLVFGISVVVLLKWVQPFVRDVTYQISSHTIVRVGVVLLVIFVVDVILTTIHIKSFNAKLRMIQMSINNKLSWANGSNQDLLDGPIKEKNGFSVRSFFKASELRVLKAFPKFRSIQYSAIIDKIKELLN